MNDQNVLMYIPQRPPFIFIDEVLEADECASRTRFTIPHDALFLHGNTFTASGLVENLAQTAAAGMGYIAAKQQKPVAIGYIGAINNLVVHEQPRVGAVIISEITFVDRIMNVQLLKGVIWLEDRQIASCELKVFIQEKTA